MQGTWITRRLRDVTAIIVVSLFMFPLFWWGLTSIKPSWAIFNKDKVIFFNFKPTAINYEVTLLGKSRSEAATAAGDTFGVGGASSYDSRQTILYSVLVAVGSTLLTILIGVPASYALSRLRFRSQQAFLTWVLSQRFLPPIAIMTTSPTASRCMSMATTPNASRSRVRSADTTYVSRPMAAPAAATLPSCSAAAARPSRRSTSWWPTPDASAVARQVPRRQLPAHNSIEPGEWLARSLATIILHHD